MKIFLLALFFLLAFITGNVFSYDTLNWMQNVDSDTALGMLAIPGTHDSGSFRIPGNVGECQDWSIGQQLENGIRFLDIRIANNGASDDFEIRHGVERLGSFKNLVMERVKNFLSSHPYETVLMSIRDEDTLDYNRLERDFIRNSAYKFYQGPITSSTKLKTVRGKVVLFNRYSRSHAIGISWRNSQLRIQDDYNLKPECKKFFGVTVCGFFIGLDYPRKAREVVSFLKDAAQSYGASYFWVNFASANWKGIYIGNSAKVSNRAIREYFNSNSKPVGSIIPMDYPNRAGVISSIIKNNLNRN